MLFDSLLKIRFHDVAGPAEDIDGLLEVLSDNCQNRAQNNTVVVQQEKMDRVGFEPTTSASMFYFSRPVSSLLIRDCSNPPAPPFFFIACSVAFTSSEVLRKPDKTYSHITCNPIGFT